VRRRWAGGAAGGAAVVGCRSLADVRCPRCLDEYEPDVVTCATCGEALVPLGAPLPPRADALLGRFHPAMADRLEAMLSHRKVTHRRVDRDDDVELYVDPRWRDDLRAELALTWAQLVHRLPEEEVLEVLSLGGAAPGWHDAPRGGWVDRAGKLVVDAEDQEVQAETARLAGPAMVTIGTVLLLLGWYVGADAVIVLAGVALLIFGLLLPR
jgi:hypothetical protein